MKTNNISLDDILDNYGEDIKSLYLDAAKILSKYEKDFDRKIKSVIILDLLATMVSCGAVTVHTNADQSPILLFLLIIAFSLAGGVIGGIALRVINDNYEKEKKKLLIVLMNDCPSFIEIAKAYQKTKNIR